MERVVSKINYVIAKPNNLYPLTVQTTDYAIAETTSGYYIYPDNKAVRLTGLHKAKNLDNDNSDVWIHEGTDGTDRRAFIKTEKLMVRQVNIFYSSWAVPQIWILYYIYWWWAWLDSETG